jgi:hypothetical protein
VPAGSIGKAVCGFPPTAQATCCCLAVAMAATTPFFSAGAAPLQSFLRRKKFCSPCLCRIEWIHLHPLKGIRGRGTADLDTTRDPEGCRREEEVVRGRVRSGGRTRSNGMKR